MFRRTVSQLIKSTPKKFTSPIIKDPSSMFTPMVIEQEGRGERSYDIYSRLLKDRIVVLWGGVNDQMAASIIGQLLFLQMDNATKPIHMYINSPGGVVTAGLAIYDTMMSLNNSLEIHTTVLGQAASMGSVLATAGTPGCRHAMPNARIMVHQPSGGAQGMASDIEIQYKEIQTMKVQLSELYVHHTGRSYSEIEKALDRDTFLSAYEAKEFGLLDHVIEHGTSDVSKKYAFRGNFPGLEPKE